MRNLLPGFFYKLVFESESGLRGLGRSKGVGTVSVRTVSWRGIRVAGQPEVLVEGGDITEQWPRPAHRQGPSPSAASGVGERARQGGLAEQAQQRPGLRVTESRVAYPLPPACTSALPTCWHSLTPRRISTATPLPWFLSHPSQGVYTGLAQSRYLGMIFE